MTKVKLCFEGRVLVHEIMPVPRRDENMVLHYEGHWDVFTVITVQYMFDMNNRFSHVEIRLIRTP